MTKSIKFIVIYKKNDSWTFWPGLWNTPKQADGLGRFLVGDVCGVTEFEVRSLCA